ncbi:Uncharacterised protein [uncultured archaeon]|nr:Uncharacterised protein [uncultured archaeon]
MTKRYVPSFSEFDGYQGMAEGTDDGYGNSWVHYDVFAKEISKEQKILESMKSMRTCLIEEQDIGYQGGAYYQQLETKIDLLDNLIDSVERILHD